MKANDAKMLLNEAGFACAFGGFVDSTGNFTSRLPQKLYVTHKGKIMRILRVCRGKIDDTDVSEAANCLQKRKCP